MSFTISTFSPRALAGRLAEGTVRVIDVRSANEFRNERIQDSENIPLETLDKVSQTRLKTSANGMPLCIVCQTGIRADKAAKKLGGTGFENIFLLTGGIDNWVHEKLPVEGKGGKSIPLDGQVRVTIGLLITASAVGCYFTQDWRWLSVPAFFGAGLIFSGLTGFCGLVRILALMPWNR